MKRIVPLSAAALAAGAVLAVPASALAAPAGIVYGTANTTATGDQDGSAIAMNRNGYVAVVWEDDRDTTNAADNTHSEIWIHLWHNGASVYEKQLSAGGTSGTNWKHIDPDVSLDDKGDAVVVWSDDPDGNGYYNVPYRVLGPTGTQLASGQANASSTGQQINPRVAADPDGTSATPSAVAFTVVWEDIQTGASATVKAAGYTNVTTKAYEVTASQTTGAHHRPDVGVAASGDATIVWDEDSDANGYYNIGLVRLARANGAVTLTRRTANSLGDLQQEHPAIAENFNGDFTVAWESDHTGALGVWARTFTSAAVANAVEVQVSTGAGANSPSVGIDDQANAVVGWVETANANDVWAVGLNPDGTTAGRFANQVVSELTADRQEQLAIAESAWGEIALSYTDDADGNTFDQVRMGTGISNSNW
ncbi:hypothetical protein [Hamadaea tsunoensis]|uniref:hypothetical protein n=1 Tax=Hamadaea tsunoensis TaxID=53368 RepID=UPI0004228898|nr:hypothetical protein [Hamadaea tsunoensis]